MPRAKDFILFGYREARNIVKLLRREPLNTPPLGCVTLDFDDVKIAWSFLRNRDTWYDHCIIENYCKAFAAWNGSKYAFSFLGGRVALSAAISALGLKPGDEVIIPGYTCIVVPNAFLFEGIRVIYSDIELDTYGLDASKLEGKINKNTKAILLHHLYGLVCRDYERIIEIARNNNLYVIEDCAQSTGAIYKGKKVGNYGDIAIYSSEQSKVFTTIQGGFVSTNDDKLAIALSDYYERAPFPDQEYTEKLLWNVFISYFSFKSPGRCWFGDLVRLLLSDKVLVSTTDEEIRGIKPSHYGCRLPTPLAAIGLNQLRKIDAYNEARRKNAKKWEDWCLATGYNPPYTAPDSIPVYLRYPVMVEPEKKRRTEWAYKELGVELGKWFQGKLHPIDIQIQDCPNADKAVKCCVNFPTII